MSLAHGMRSDLRLRTKLFAIDVIRACRGLPRSNEAGVLGRQLIRSGTSVGANYREAFRARSRAEFIAKMGDCLRELEETGYWLELLVDTEIVPSAPLAAVRQETNELTAIFVAVLKSTRASASPS